jgi:type 1 fimbria pilin
MKSARLVLATAMMALGLMGQAEAKVTHLGTLSSGQIVTFDDTFAPGKNFKDVLAFNLKTPLDITGILGDLNMSSFSAVLKGPSGFSKTISLGNYNFDDLAVGHYRMVFTGVTSSSIKGGFGTILTAVPETDTWLMLVIGAGLVVFQLRRKQKTLRHRPLTTA